jgi:putative transposase
MYNWRKMSDKDRKDVLKERKVYRRPWHAPPHFDYEGDLRFIITAACFEHKPVIGASAGRMSECESDLIQITHGFGAVLYGWCILPNHYHLLIRTDRIKEFLREIGRFHGGSSYRWNAEDRSRGRKVWFRSVERSMRSERHFYASLNYIHHNPVKHGYVSRWQDWPYSSAVEFLEKVGKQRAEEMWREYPVLDYGKDWDID